MEQLTDLVDFKEGWYISAEEKERALFRDWLLGVLKTNEQVTITFKKSDGTDRVMNCTLKDSVIPLVENPKASDNLCTVWDTDLNSWRSFKFENIKQINFTL